MNTTLVTQSGITSYETCPQMYKYQYLDGLVSKANPKPANLFKGDWLHTWLEYYYAYQVFPDSPPETLVKRNHALKTINQHYRDEIMNTPEILENYSTILSDMELMQKAYKTHWQKENIKVLETEFTIHGTLPSGSRFRGKADALVELPDGRRYLMDHKTYKNRPTEHDRLSSYQAALYVYYANLAGLNVDGFMWNYIIWKPGKGIKINKDLRLAKLQQPIAYATILQSLYEFGCNLAKDTLPDHVTDSKDVEDYVHSEGKKFVTHPNYSELLETARKQLHDPSDPYGEPDDDRLFYRVILERTPAELVQKIGFADQITQTLNKDTTFIPRPGGHCSWCSFVSLCDTRNRCGNVEREKNENYLVTDPDAYFNKRVPGLSKP